MKTGKTLSDLAVEIERQAESKKDFLAKTETLQITAEQKLIMPATENTPEQNLELTENFHSQIASRLKIPRQYYNRMKETAPELYADNVNHWLHREPEVRMVRTLDNKARAFLSQRYRLLDNFDLLKSVLPIFANQDLKCDVVSCEVTDNRLYIKALFPELEAEVKGSSQVNDLVQAGVVISNSEVGAGSLRVEPLIYRLVCTNGMIANTAMKKYHVGRGSGNFDDAVQEVLTDKTRAVTDAAFWMSVHDVIHAAFNKDLFMGEVAKLESAATREITGDPVAAVTEIKKQFNFSDNQGSSILQHLIKGGDLSQWGIANAVTRTAEDQGDYDTATTLERVGGQIIELKQTDWRRIAEAA